VPSTTISAESSEPTDTSSTVSDESSTSPTTAVP
jgi:hypothetical protein